MLGAIFFLLGQPSSWPWGAVRLVSLKSHLLTQVLRAAASGYGPTSVGHAHLLNRMEGSQQLCIGHRDYHLVLQRRRLRLGELGDLTKAIHQ